MSKNTRRQFLKQTGIGLAGATLLPARAWTAPLGSLDEARPPHQGMVVPAVHGYAAQSVVAGEKISFRISSTVAHRLSICRLGQNTDSTVGDETLHHFQESAPNPQPIHPGSYVWIRKTIVPPITALSLECWVRPAKLDAAAGLITQGDSWNRFDFALRLLPGVVVSFLVGETSEPAAAPTDSGVRLKTNRWQHLVATWDGHEKKLWLDGQLAWKGPSSATGFTKNPLLRLGALSDNGLASGFLDGDMAMPVIYKRALSAEEIAERFRQRCLVAAKDKGVLACWTFAEEKGDRVADVSGHRRHGKIVNHGTWQIGGPSFDHEVLRFTDYDPAKDAQRGHGLRLASDDLYDCGWKATHEYTIPREARSGVYVGRIEFSWADKPHLYHITFIVKKAARRKRAPILVLCSTNTWRAYNGASFSKPDPNLLRNSSTNGMANSPGEPPAYCFYRRHAAGQGTYQLGLNMPFMGGDPYLLYGKNYSHLARAERFAQIWLEQAGYEFDVVTDLDLHRDPKLLRGYKTVLVNGHSEYWSLPAYFGLDSYLARGGNLIVLSGNSLFWRVSFNEEGSILECRKVDAPGEQMQPHERGESWHSHDGKRGGLLRECGYPGWKLIGLETLGWYDESMFSAYAVESESHPLFNQPEKLELKNGAQFGSAPGGAMPRANGHEIDVRLSTLAALQENPSPAGGSVLAEPRGIVTLANGQTDWSKGGSAFDYFFRPIKPKKPQGGEMIFWTREEGGMVFNAGAIGAGQALVTDPKFQMLMRNVLAHFGVSPSRPA